ncbi:MAG: PhnD/SsuA/transferrin family substrate-binding protein, partial [Candidatus Sumerlaeota bacterium]|nr:PhnD/SsuA/transferrin family substrate-binding protein [Candidatus Sumerlaeota bacterium]
IGYLPQPAEDGLDESMARRLADYLRRDKALAGAFRETGYSGEVAMQPADGYSDMANRLDHEQFDLAFCPAALFATKRDNYKAILQERHPGDIVDSRGDQPARRQGVIFVGPTSPLFHEEATTATLRRVLAESEFAVPSAHDAAGLLFPILALADEFGIPPKQLRLRFCGSSREVVKHVVSGLAEIGACDSATLDRWLADQAQGLPLGSLVRELPIPMRPVPTDPVIVRGSLDPAYSKLGQAMQEALQRFFRTREAAGFGLLRARDSFYDALGQDLARLEDLRERGLRGAAGTPAPAAETPPDQGARP